MQPINRRQFLSGASLLALTSAATRVPAAARTAVRIHVGSQRLAPSPPRLFGFGGNIWQTPRAFVTGLDERILDMPRLGLTRVSLGTQVFQPATSRQDLEQRLAALPLNDFLRKFRERGGQILLGLDGTPRWMASNKAEDVVKGPEEPAFNLSPPRNFEEWSDVVGLVVRHFNGRLGLDAYYEFRNEPNYYYRGTTDQYLRQYVATAIGARRADPRAKVGGPSISEVIGTGTFGEPVSTAADKQRVVELTLDQRYLFRQFVERAASTPVPELKLPRVPLDFFSWHSFYVDPSAYYRVVVPFMRSVIEGAGYPSSTPMILSEWNLAAVPPYPEGDLNAGHVGAAYVASSLIAMHEAGLAAQSFQMYVDPGSPGYLGGMFDNFGLARAQVHAFAMFARLRGEQLKTTSSDPWVKAVAYRDGTRVHIVVAALVPTPEMVKTTLPIVQNLSHGDFSRSIVRDGLAAAVAQGKGLPEPLAMRAREIESESARLAQDDLRRATQRRDGWQLQVDLADFGTPKRVTQQLIDASHGNVYPRWVEATRLLERGKRKLDSVPDRLPGIMAESGVPRGAADAAMRELRSGKSFDAATASLPPELQKKAAKAVEAELRGSIDPLKRLIAEIEAWPEAALREEPLRWPADGKLQLELQANAVVLLTLER